MSEEYITFAVVNITLIMKTSNILKTAAAILTAMTVAACNQQKFHVEGTISEAEDSVLYLENVGLESVTAVDSVRLGADGTFTFSGDVAETPEFYRLRINDQIINICIDSTETVSVKAAFPTMITQYEVNGSDNCQKIKELALKQIDLQQRCIGLQRSMARDVAADSIIKLVDAYKQDVLYNYIYKAPDKSYAYFALFQTLGGLFIFNPQANPADIKAFNAVATSWDLNYPEALRTKNLHNIAINGMKTQRIVEYNQQQTLDASQVESSGIIDIALTDNHGQTRRLSDLKGKVVLLDFHVFSMDESPKRILAMRELYNKFSAQGLEIYQVALDGNEHFWKQQTAALPWISVRDPQGISSQWLAIYNVQAVPDFFLIDRQNNIVKRNAQISDLEAEIRKLL